MADLDAQIRAQLDLGEAIIKGADDGVLRPLAEVDQWRAALLAVLELHQRLDEGVGWGSAEPGDYGTVKDVCPECGKADEFAVRWPCPTVRAIAKALDVLPE